MNTRMDAEPSDDPEHAAEEPAAADAPAEAETETAPTEDDADSESDSEEFDHLDSLSDGVGCTEIWEHLSESRDGE